MVPPSENTFSKRYKAADLIKTRVRMFPAPSPQRLGAFYPGFPAKKSPTVRRGAPACAPSLGRPTGPPLQEPSADLYVIPGCAHRSTTGFCRGDPVGRRLWGEHLSVPQK